MSRTVGQTGPRQGWLVPQASVTLAAGASATRSLTVPYTLGATDAGIGATHVRLAADAGAWGSWIPLNGGGTWTFSSADGSRTLHAQVRDAAGNVSAAVMGRTYAGPGATIGPALTFGYLAAEDFDNAIETMLVILKLDPGRTSAQVQLAQAQSQVPLALETEPMNSMSATTRGAPACEKVSVPCAWS